MSSRIWEIEAFVLEAVARDAVGDPAAAEQALNRALELAGPDGLLFPFLLDPVPALLERHSRALGGHGSLMARLVHLDTHQQPTAPEATPDVVSAAERRVLRYLPTQLTVAEIAAELYVSANTVKTHVRRLYAKLGVHRRTEAVERACALGILGPVPHPPQPRRAIGGHAW
jgi:LuxR family maltose regulon positive regulatory protein